MTKNQIEKLNFWTAIIALIVSGLSLWFSYFTYNENNAERITLEAQFVNDNYPTNIYPIGKLTVIPVFWKLIFSNNSNKTISLIEYDINANNDKISFYSHLNEGIFLDLDSKEITSLPLNIPSGESKVIFVKVGILCDSIASATLSRHDDYIFQKDMISEYGEFIRFNQAKIKLANNGIDFYGNKAKITYSGEDILMYESGTSKKQEFIISFKTGTGRKLSKSFSIYMNE